MAEVAFIFALLAKEGSALQEYRMPVIECSLVVFVISAGLYFYLGKLELDYLGLANHPAKPENKTAPRKKTTRKR